MTAHAKLVTRIIDVVMVAEDAVYGNVIKVLQLFRLAAELAKRVGDQQRLANAACVAYLISRDRESESYRWMMSELAQLTDSTVRAAADEYLARLDQHARGEKLPGSIVTSEKQIYENLAAGAGIDLDDPNDPLAVLVKQGIQDLNPGRVLRNCEHIFITVPPRQEAVSDYRRTS